MTLGHDIWQRDNHHQRDFSLFLFPFQSALSAITINWRSEATAGCTTAVTSAAADAIAIATLAAKIILFEFCSALDWCAVSDGAENRLFRHRLCSQLSDKKHPQACLPAIDQQSAARGNTQ
jgi:hypothetical protein